MHPKVEVKIKKIAPQVIVPSYQTGGASGADVYAFLEQEMILEPHQTKLVPTGLFFEIPQGFEIQVRPRSGLAFKSGITVLNSPGTIDADYRGELKIILHNSSDQNFIIQPNDRIAQIVICPVFQATFLDGDLSQTHRGEKGFGSTGLS